MDYRGIHIISELSYQSNLYNVIKANVDGLYHWFMDRIALLSLIHMNVGIHKIHIMLIKHDKTINYPPVIINLKVV